MTVAALADDLGYSQRHLYRSVVAAVGYGPKRLARILRLQRALGAGRNARDADVSLARLAHESGFADQAHFSNECLVLAGATPSVLLAR
jgi:AraC-like DNA-binding protein